MQMQYVGDKSYYIKHNESLWQFAETVAVTLFRLLAK